MPITAIRIASTVVFGAGLICAAPLGAFAQTALNGTPPVANSHIPQANGTAATGKAMAPNGTLREHDGMLRTTTLVGAKVYNDHGRIVGTVDDLLVSTSGNVQRAVLSVGGFLGVGTHYVAVSMNQLKIEPSESNGMMHNGAAGTSAATGIPSSSGTAVGTGVGAMRGVPHQQYFSVVLPGATKASLKSMPEFKFNS